MVATKVEPKSCFSAGKSSPGSKRAGQKHNPGEATSRKKCRRFCGEVVTLSDGHYTAGVAVVGATLERLQFVGRDLVMQHIGYCSDHRGAVGVPWASYFVDGAYTFQGKVNQLPLFRDEAGYGLLRYREFKICETSAKSVELSHRLWPQPGYPFTLEITVKYALDRETGLETTVTSRNCGKEVAPYGVCGHPYVIAGPEPVARWTVTVPHTLVLRSLATPEETIELAHTSSLDMRAGRGIGNLQLDDAFGGLELDSEGRWKVTVTAPGGTGVEVSSDYCCPWVALYGGQLHDPPKNRRKGLAVQPSTSPPNAFSTGTDLITLEPGESHTASWRIRGLDDLPESVEADEDRPSEPDAPNFSSDNTSLE